MTFRPTTAMVLAAGLGTRMRPLTDTLPKPLVQLAGRPLIDHVLDRMVEIGIGRAVVNVHHRADQILAHLAERRRPQIVISDERGELMGTGGGVLKALENIGHEAFLAHNADSVWLEGVGRNLERLFQGWDDARMDCLLLLALASASIGYQARGDFAFDADGRIRRRRENEVVPFAYAGVQILHPRLFAAAPRGPFSLNLLWDRAIEAGRAHGMRMDGIWMHVGSPAALAEAETCFLAERPY